jgi:allantoinase
MLDTLIHSALVVNASRTIKADVGLQGGKIAAMGLSLNEPARDTLDSDGLVLMPGLIDPHVHLNEPGREHWEGLETGTRALAAGGVTTFFDMPLNSTPVVTTVEAFHRKQALIERKSLVNGYQWGGLIPSNLGDLEGLHRAGVIGFKAFMSNSGIDEFPASDDYTLFRGMEIAAKLGSIVAVHAESDTLTGGLSREAHAQNKTDIRDYLASRPILAEQEAITRSLLYAKETGCALYVVHTSSAAGVSLIHEAQIQDINVTCETCPHYLVLTDTDVERLGAVAKCAPPLRSEDEQKKLWEALLRGEVQTIASDHSPSSPDLKNDPNFFKVWGGISSCQSTLQLLLTFGHFQRGLSLERIVAMTSTNTAKAFALNKGRIEIGMDADVVLVDLNAKTTLQAIDLHYRHKQSPYVGMNLRGKVVRTIVGGKTVYHEGTFYG